MSTPMMVWYGFVVGYAILLAIIFTLAVAFIAKGHCFMGGLVIVSGVMLCLGIDVGDEKRDMYFMHAKPTCQEETVSCLTAKAEWYRDSARLSVSAVPRDTSRQVDSLKAIVNQFEKKATNDVHSTRNN